MRRFGLTPVSDNGTSKGSVRKRGLCYLSTKTVKHNSYLYVHFGAWAMFREVLFHVVQN